ncbi:hypothetical protein BDW22DRAFT_1431796 [Trametopsis cervina]|nr:hypothetical protein BDW22DRAFT_1431796 [Trametopsis cervina]
MSSTSSSAGSSVGQKVKGAFQAVHGIGESIRGNAMDFVDSATGSERAGHGAAVRGQQETEVGVANMERRQPNVNASATTTGYTPASQTAPTATQTAPTAAPVGGAANVAQPNSTGI